MQEAKSFPFMNDFFSKVIKLGHRIVIISHKTRYPFIGEKYDLHEAAKDWIKKNLIKDEFPTFSLNDCFFEPTKDDKVKKIQEMKCDFYIDDLPDILQNQFFPSGCHKILFDPENNYRDNYFNNISIKNSWLQIIKEINFNK
jgi:hypothetical protein